MSTNPLLDTLQQQFTPSTIQQLSTSLGTDPGTTQNAIAAALPAILAGLASNASQPQGATALNNALDDHDGGILDNIGGMLGGAAAGGIGGKILGHIFGPKRGPVEQGVGRASGLDPQQTARLLMMLAPIVMGVLGRMKKTNNVDANQLPNVLQQSVNQFPTGGAGAPGGDILGQLSGMLGGMFGKK